MTGFGNLAQTLFDMFGPYWDEYQGATLDNLRDYLADEDENPVLRVWVDAGPAPAIQATTIGILRQLVADTEEHGFGYAGTIEVCYAPGTDEDPTLPKLYRLLPELGGESEGQVGQATVELIEWTGTNLTDLVNLGFTGSADDGTGTPAPNFAARIGVRYLLRLAPYLSGEPHQIQAPQAAPVDLTSPAMPGAATLRQRAYFTSTPLAEPDWDLYADGPYANAAAIIKLLTTSDLDGFGVLPVSGISSDPVPGVATPAVDRMFEVIAGVVASQRDEDNEPAKTARGIAILSCGTFGSDTDQEQLAGLLRGGYCAQEQNLAALLETEDTESTEASDRIATGLDAALQGHKYRAEWLDRAEAGSRVELLWSPDETEVDGWLDWLAADGDHVLFLQLGTLPEQLFAWCMSQAAWPPVFAGTEEASLAQNLGTAYFHLARPGNQGTQYPPPIVGYDLFPGTPYVPKLYPTATGRLVSDAASQLSAPLWSWNPEDEINPAELVGQLVRDYLGEPDDGPLHAYFGGVAENYAGGIADKLAAGLALLRYVQSGRDDPASLTELLTDLANNTQGPLLRLAPGVFNPGSGICDFYSAFLDADLVIASPSVQANAGVTEIVVTGSTLFSGVPLTATIVFTAPQGIIIASATYECSQSWLVDQIPWISFGTPRLIIDTPDRLLAPIASAGGIVAGTTAQIAFRLPVAAGHWLLAADFGGGQLDLEDFFTLAGGVDLVRSLPSPLDGLAGFGVTNAQLLYDTGAEELAFAGFRMATAEPFTLVPGVVVDQVSAEVVVQRPADLALRRTDWVVRGQFTVGSGVVGIAATGPELEFSGTLRSGVITLAALAGKFAPGVDVGDVPQPPFGAVTAFDAALTQATGDYDVSCQLNVGWSIGTDAGALFTINGLGFTATSLSGLVTGQVTGDVVVADVVPLALSANYADGPGWTFHATQPAGQALSMDKLVAQFTGWEITSGYEIVDLGLVVAADGSSWEVSGRTAEFWDVPFVDGLKVLAEFRSGRGETGFFARVDTQWNWHGAEIVLFYDYDASVTSFGLEWGGLEGLVTGPDDHGDYLATLTFADTVTVGSIIETMVSWATGSAYALEAPWSVLNGIPLANLSLKYTFSGDPDGTNSVAFSIDIGPIELGFGRIDSISVIYDDEAERKVAITLDGSFAWNTGDNAVGTPGELGPWDASRPGDAPAPPGLGNKYVDVRMLALGQHVTKAELTEMTSVPAAINLMSTMEEPSGDTIPEVTFDPAVGWIVGADLGLVRFGPDDGDGGDGGTDDSGYLITAQFVFNDPHLYALRLALAGPAAKVFAGLDFQLMYRQISDTVGVYQGELALPDAMRHLSIGGYSVTLPVFAVAVYTNGDFQVDVGFPWGGDFSRSFTIEAVVAPGIPVVGSAGFYFGKLSSATSQLVPAISNGTFSPVLTFGLGMSVGFGKSVSYGLLKAGFSVTAAGIIEGVLATFNPYQVAAPSPSATPAQLQDGYYFWLRGTFGLAGRLYGSVDFSVIKADVDVSFTLMLQITYESYVSVSMTVIVAVDVSVSIRIDVGLFTIRISFSFSARIRETLTFDNGGTPPWIAAGPSAARLSASRRRHVHQRRPSEAALSSLAPNWGRLLPAPPAAKIALTGMIAPAMTVARDESNPNAVVPCWVFQSFIQTVPPGSGNLGEAIAQAGVAAAGPDTSFEAFAKMVLRWAIAAISDTSLSWENVDKQVISEADLTRLLDVVLRSDDNDPAPMSPADIDTFMNGQFNFAFQPVPVQQQNSADLTLFPMPPSVVLRIFWPNPAEPVTYSLAGYNSISQAGLAALRQYFDQLAVVVSDSQSVAGQASATGPLSMAQWMQSDYFLLVARQMVQLTLDALRDYKYVFVPKETVGQIVTAVNGAGELTGEDAITVADVFAANPSRALQAGAELSAGARLAVPAGAGTSFETIAVTTLGSAVSATALAQANATTANLLAAGAVVVYQDRLPYVVKVTDTLVDVAWHFGATFGDFLSGAAGLLGDPGLLARGAAMMVPLLTFQAQAGSSFETIAHLPAYASGAAGFTASQLATQNAGCPILRLGETVGYKGAKYVIQAGDALADAARALGAPSMTEFLAGNPLLLAERLLADVAVVALPPFQYLVGADDTLASIAARLGTTIDVLAMAPGNASVDLFAWTAELPWIDIPHLPKYLVGKLITEAQRTLGIHKLSSMVARYGMHGTRLPTTGITSFVSGGMWVIKTTEGLELPPRAGLYALTGQQVKLPTGPDAYQVDVSRPGTAPGWYSFTTGTTMSFPLRAAGEDSQRLHAVLNAVYPNPPDVGLEYLGAGEMTTTSPASYPLTVVTDWQSPTLVQLPYGKLASNSTVPALRLWTLPGALTALGRQTPADPATPGKAAPRFAVSVARYDEATGATVTEPVASHGWASVVEFTVKRVPPVPGSPSSETSYEISGAGGADVVVLERIVAQVGSNAAAFYRLVVGFAPDGTTTAPTGIQTGDPALVTFGIAQVNLSTDTRPPALAAASASASDAPGLLNTAPEFVRLLWQASITNSGGYFLYYYDAAGTGGGLPERIFDDQGEARLGLIVIYASGGTPVNSDRVSDYLTSVVTGELIDTSLSAVVATASPMEPSIETRNAVDLTLGGIAERSYSDLGQLAAANGDLQLADGCQLAVRHGVYQAPVGGITLEAVATRFRTSVGALTTANPQGLTPTIAFPTAIYLPTATFTVVPGQVPNTLATLATYYGVALTRLAVDNAGVAGLFKLGQDITVPGGPTVTTATVPAGSAAVAARRHAPAQPAWPKPDYAIDFVRNTFSLLSYQVSGNGFFTLSNLGLPAGATVPADSTAPLASDVSRWDKVRLAADSETWEYRQAVPYYRVAAPVSTGSPYQGVGSILQVGFGWQDYYGNTLRTTLDAPPAGPVESVAPRNYPPMLAGYTDEVLGLRQWPSVSSAWTVYGNQAGRFLWLGLTFDASRYEGPIRAEAGSSARSINVTFTRAVDASSAGQASNYVLDGGPAVISVKVIATNEVTLQFTADLAAAAYVLSVSGVRGAGADQTEYYGTLTFPGPGKPGPASSAIIEAATVDLIAYTTLRYQLTDPLGVAVTLATTLSSQPLALTAAELTALRSWLFTASLNVLGFLTARAAGNYTARPPGAHTIDRELPRGPAPDPADLRADRRLHDQPPRRRHPRRARQHASDPFGHDPGPRADRTGRAG